MNTRLQVEHPVTEMVTGFDLVREQIRVAAGETLSFAQEDVGWRGHAVECRVYAEDPEHGFMPSPGRVTTLRVPAGPCVRDDSGVYEGAEVSIYYDPLISKLATWGRTRAEAVGRMRRALAEYTVGGIKTTLPFFRECMRDEEFLAGRLDTGFIERFNERRRDARPSADEGTTAGADEEMLAGEVERRDMAAVAAALAYMDSAHNGSQHKSAPQPPSRWKLAGRAALHQSRV
jgi:acetyl-CoA carboxylase biotin carboxylase subunit